MVRVRCTSSRSPWGPPSLALILDTWSRSRSVFVRGRPDWAAKANKQSARPEMDRKSWLKFCTCKQWGSEIWPYKIRKHLKSRLFEGRISNGPVFKWSGFCNGYSYSPNYSKTGPFKIRPFLSGLQMVFDEMAVIFPDFKWLSFWISDPVLS